MAAQKLRGVRRPLSHQYNRRCFVQSFLQITEIIADHRPQLLLIRRILDAAQEERPELPQRLVRCAAVQRAQDQQQADGVVGLARLDHRPDCALRATRITVTDGQDMAMLMCSYFQVDP